MTITPDDLEELLYNPEQTAKIADLIYISEDKLSIERKKWGKGFIYKLNGKKISDAHELERYKQLVIPPAWRDVKISHHKNGHLQVVGLDEKSRKQYKYHPIWSQLRNQTKFYKMISFGKALPKLRKQIAQDLEEPIMNERKILALVIRLMEETHIRIGNEYYASKNKTYGLSTLRTKHLKSSRGKLKFEFVGKKGKEHSVAITNKKLIKLINKCEEIPGWELFKYYDENGDKQTVDSTMINAYIQEVSGSNFTAKDYRTWAASKIYFETLYEIGYEEEENDNAEAILKAIDASAEALGNTRAVCRSYYVHPFITQKYKTRDIETYFKKIKEVGVLNHTSLSNSEKVMLQLISDYEIDLNTTITN